MKLSRLNGDGNRRTISYCDNPNNTQEVESEEEADDTQN